jgi:hypothetical protein
MVSRLRKAREAESTFPRVVLVHHGTTEHGERFFRRRWPEAVAIADTEGALYDAFDVERARWSQLFGLSVLLRSLGAAVRGNGVGKPVGDVRRMPGAFLVHQGQVAWAQEPEHVGDHPNLPSVHAMSLMLAQSAAAKRAAGSTTRDRTSIPGSSS